MSDEKTREVPLTDVMGIAEVSDEPTETLPSGSAEEVRIAGRGRIAGNLRTRHARKLCGPFGTSDRFRQIG